MSEFQAPTGNPWSVMGQGVVRIGDMLAQIQASNEEKARYAAQFALEQAREKRMADAEVADRAQRQQQIDATLEGQQYARAKDVASTLIPNTEIPEAVATFLTKHAPEIAAARLRTLTTLPNVARWPVGGFAGSPTPAPVPPVPVVTTPPAAPRTFTNWTPTWDQAQKLDEEHKRDLALATVTNPSYRAQIAGLGQIVETPEMQQARALAQTRAQGVEQRANTNLAGQWSLREAQARIQAASQLSPKDRERLRSVQYQLATRQADQEAASEATVMKSPIARLTNPTAHLWTPAERQQRALDIYNQGLLALGLDPRELPAPTQTTNPTPLLGQGVLNMPTGGDTAYERYLKSRGGK